MCMTDDLHDKFDFGFSIFLYGPKEFLKFVIFVTIKTILNIKNAKYV